jgi:FKBP-type peptidyl-prolyl cis-trans isomerase
MPPGSPIDIAITGFRLATIDHRGQARFARYHARRETDVSETQTTASGITIEDVNVGKGAECPKGATVRVHYTGTLENGATFDSSVGGDPIEFPLAKLIKGWQEGIPGMKVGGTRKLTIPADLAYGREDVRDNAGNVVIPGNSTLIFEIELLGVR